MHSSETIDGNKLLELKNPHRYLLLLFIGTMSIHEGQYRGLRIAGLHPPSIPHALPRFILFIV
jgi:hypothetical protein